MAPVTFAPAGAMTLSAEFLFLETTRQIEMIFNLKPMRDSRNKLYSNTPGHMTKMAAMPKYGPEPLCQLS